MRRSLLVAPLAGYPALVCRTLLADYLDRASAGVHPDYVTQLRHALVALDQAAREWVEWRRATAEIEAEAAADARAAALAAAARAPSREVTTRTAATILGLSPNRVRQLCRSGRLAARRAGRTWLVDTTALAAHGGQRGWTGLTK